MEYNIQQAGLSQDNEPQLIEITNEECGDIMASFFQSTMTQQDFDAAIIKDYCVVQSGELRFASNEGLADIKTRIENWVSENNLNFWQEDPNDLFLSIDSVEIHPPINAITFQIFSETEENIRTQIERFLSFCKELEGIKKFEAEILKTVTPIVWTNEH